MKNYLTNLLILEQSIAFFFLLQRYEISRYENEKTSFFAQYAVQSISAG